MFGLQGSVKLLDPTTRIIDPYNVSLLYQSHKLQIKFLLPLSALGHSLLADPQKPIGTVHAKIQFLSVLLEPPDRGVSEFS